MAWRTFISFVVLCFFLLSCAQVGVLSGGERDRTPPRVNWNTSSMQNGEVNFREKKIELVFDEYFRLANPQQTIAIVPNDAKINASFRKKTLILDWEEDLQENTTYSIYLNKTIRDLSEGNDSIMQIVFSTGPQLDSLSYTVFVEDAQSGKSVSGIVVGLFHHPDSLKPYYFGQTDNKGKLRLNYLKAGNYYVRSFNDENKNMKLDPTEQQGFKTETLVLDTSYIDSSAIRVYYPESKPKITSFKFVSHRLFAVGANRSLEDAQLWFNNELLDEEQIIRKGSDSLLFIAKPRIEPGQQLVVTSHIFNDTLTTRVPTKQDSLGIITTLIKNEFFPKDSIVLEYTDFIQEVLSEKISLINPKDSSLITVQAISAHKNHLIIEGADFPERIELQIEEGALISETGIRNKKFNANFTFYQEKDLGQLKVDLSAYSEQIILRVIRDGKEFSKETISEAHSLSLELPAGIYTFEIIVDANANGKWDSGSLTDKLQPEEIHRFSEPVKIRSGWEMDIKLEPNP